MQGHRAIQQIQEGQQILRFHLLAFPNLLEYTLLKGIAVAGVSHREDPASWV